MPYLCILVLHCVTICCPKPAKIHWSFGLANGSCRCVSVAAPPENGPTDLGRALWEHSRRGRRAGNGGATNGCRAPRWRWSADTPRWWRSPPVHRNNSWKSPCCWGTWGWSSHPAGRDHIPFCGAKGISKRKRCPSIMKKNHLQTILRPIYSFDQNTKHNSCHVSWIVVNSQRAAWPMPPRRVETRAVGPCICWIHSETFLVVAWSARIFSVSPATHLSRKFNWILKSATSRSNTGGCNMSPQERSEKCLRLQKLLDEEKDHACSGPVRPKLQKHLLLRPLLG